MEMKAQLLPEQLEKLRKSDQLSQEEIAYIAGDLIVAENVTKSTKRVLGKVADLLTETNRRVLKG